MHQYPTFLQNLIHQHLKKNFLKGNKSGKSFNDKDLKFFAKGAERLSTFFTEDRGGLPANYLNDPVLRSGYLLYFLPVNFLKVVRVLNEFDPSELVSGKIRVLDLGSGPGTGTLGLMAFYAEMLRQKKIKDAWLDFTLVDHNYNILRDAKSFHDGYKEHLEKTVPGFHSVASVKNFDFRRMGLDRFLRNFKFHIILLGNVLNELPGVEEKVSLVSTLLTKHLEPNKGKLILIEPALRRSSRELQLVRDEVVTNQKLGFVQAPCLHQEGCPLNKLNQRDWCHFYLSWECPPFIQKVDRLIGNQKERLALSYLILGSQERDVKKLFKKPEDTWRVISNLMSSNGKREAVLCGPGGRYHVTRLDRDRAIPNGLFDKMGRGDLIELSIPESSFTFDGQTRLDKKSPLNIVRKM